MVGERAVLLINLASRGIFDAERLNGGHDYHGLPFDRSTGEPERLFDCHYFDHPAGQLQCAAVWMSWITQCVGGLVENRIAWYQPEDHGPLGPHKFPLGQPSRVT